MKRGITTVAVLTAWTFGLAIPAHGESPVSSPEPLLNAVSGDGSHVLFTTGETISPDDHESDIYQDVYLWSGGSPQLISAGPAGGNGPEHAHGNFISEDGSRVIFQTSERLIASDQDDARDLYEWANGQLSILSTGSADPNSGQFGLSFFEGASRDGSHVFFTASSPLVLGDPQGVNLYERANGVTRLIAPEPFIYPQVARDGAKFVFTTQERLAPEDTDSLEDVYEWDNGGPARLVSTGSTRTPAKDYWSDAGSANLHHVLLSTLQPLSVSDLDSSVDVYLRSGTTTQRVSKGPIGGNGAYGAHGLAVSDDGTRVLFETAERLTPDDLDDQNDIYAWTPDGTELVSPGPVSVSSSPVEFVTASPDARRVVFSTAASLVAADADTSADVYERYDRTTRLLSGPSPSGPVNRGAYVVGFSDDATHVFMQTSESLSPLDTDGLRDVYDSQPLSLVSSGPGDAGLFSTDIQSACCSASHDGSAYGWGTLESLAPDDTDDPAASPNTSHDLYLRKGGQTYLISH